MANVHYSYRGQPVDMDALAKKFEKEIALGNARMNAKGDIVGKGGKIIKTREQQLAEYKEANAPIKTGKVNHWFSVRLPKEIWEKMSKVETPSIQEEF